MKTSKRYTFSELINKTNQKYPNIAINLSILFYLSNKVKTSLDLLIKRNHEIDFDFRLYQKLINEYYVNSKPLAHIIHSATFNDLELIVDNQVHAPRNETEFMVKTLQALLLTNYEFKSILDLCAGSGNIGISIKAHFNYIDLTLVDIDEKAIVNIKKNLNKYQIKANVINEDVKTFFNQNNTKFDVIVMNPPYVPINELNKEMLKYESKISFNNSSDCLYLYKLLLDNLPKITSDNYIVCCEFGYNQKQDLIDLIKKYKLLKNTTFYKDLNQNDRFFIIKK